MSREAWGDVTRFIRHLIEHDSPNAARAGAAILSGLRVLRDHPFIGRRRGEFRELVLGRRPLNYVALYVYDEVLDTVTVHALRHQREHAYH